MTSAEPAPGLPARPADAADGALYDAVAVEHGIIYGYGLVSAHSTPEDNWLVSTAIAAHRERREAAIALLEARDVAPPLPAAGYQMPGPVRNPDDAATLAVQMEQDAAAAWRAVVEQASAGEDRAFGVEALTRSAVFAAQWTQVLGDRPVTVAFPGGNE
ncbi:ferritin-like domain-containing protein [Mycolicibacterium sp. S2-37]|uniref:ferritin-like domain-containing protein n=1 Tax=Mycolicibacterium sp. S2-37 TaxID=2810297 RepID=UPI001A94523B|nr:ferritin-like domain-containing protein [Mycolicibacterium sp. S2-37]MBO0677088.1 ferritin-like domain-containing protein [Mycolicibacterium sp. S2-37]